MQVARRLRRSQENSRVALNQRQFARKAIWANVHALVAHCTEQTGGIGDALRFLQNLAGVTMKEPRQC